MIRTLAAAALALLLAGAALANGVEDGNAGLEALNRGDYDLAVRLFTRAIAAADLNPEDREFAFVNRGRAYLGKKAYKLAAADFRQAGRMKPGDEDAQEGLRLALAGARGDAVRLPPRAPSQAQLIARWGAMGTLAGKYWLLSGGKGPQMWARYQWQEPGRLLAFDGSDRKGRPVAGQCALDAAASTIACATSYQGATSDSAVALQANGWEESLSANTAQVRQSVSRAGPDAFTVTTQTYRNGTWTTAPVLSLAAVPEETIAALKWKAHKGSPFVRFLGDLGKSLLAVTVAGAPDQGQGQDQGDPNAPPPQ
ncbi:MAG TPA: tetratricopeptide repeat protein [Allosphingosinicella sp.]|jgi:tetratricopeptide (TPR) repeat protein